MEFSETGKAFGEVLLARHPEWRPFVQPYEPSGRSGWQPGSFWLDMPSPHNPSLVLWTIVQDSGWAEVHLVHRNADGAIDWVTEQVFDFRPGEQWEVFAGILAFIEGITTGEIVVVSQRSRFLWWTSTSHTFKVLAAGDRDVDEVFTWLGPEHLAMRSG